MTCIVAVCLGADAWIGMLDSGALKDSDVIRCDGPIHALESVRNRRPERVLIDLEVLGEDEGLELVAEIATIWPDDGPAVTVLHSDPDGIRRRAVDRGAADCRRAPIGRKDWLDFLEGGEGGTASADQA